MIGRKGKERMRVSLFADLDGTTGYLVLLDASDAEVSKREPVQFKALGDKLITDRSSVELVPTVTGRFWWRILDGRVWWAILDHSGNILWRNDAYFIITELGQRVTIRMGPWNEILAAS